MSVDNWRVGQLLIMVVVLPLAYAAMFTAIAAFLAYFIIREVLS
jgi:hypothetical protein